MNPSNKAAFRSFCVFFLYLSCGNVALGYMEGWDGLSTAYHMSQVFAAVGYGDVAPSTTYGRLFSSLVFIPVRLLAVVMGVNAFSEWAHYSDITKSVSCATFLKMDRQQHGFVTEAQFLRNAGLVDEETMQFFGAQYAKLDPKRPGFFSLVNLRHLARREHTAHAP